MLEIDDRFPGGNIVLDSIKGDDVRIHQDLRDTGRNWFYWCMAVRGAAGRTLRFHFTRSRALGVRGPAVSQDQGMSWRWLGADPVGHHTFSYTFAPDVTEVRFSFGMPYQASHWSRFVRRMAGNPHFSLHRLCTTPKGREVEYALLGRLHGEPAHRVVITSRHHCCEMMPSYAIEGVIQWIAESATPAAQWLRTHATILIVPFVDMDGVEDGDQGKSRRPRDHGRDYEGESLYAATAALRALLPTWGGGRLRVVLDLHCPWIAGPTDEVLYLVGSRDAEIAREQERFAEMIESVCQGPLPFAAADLLHFGTGWNTAANFTGGNDLCGWASDLPGVRLATTLEVPYANAKGVEVNAESARQLGPDLAAAIADYLRATSASGGHH